MGKKDELISKCGEIFMRELDKLYEREEADPAFMAQEAFPDFYTRAECGVNIAVKPVISFAALAFAKHHQEKHGEDVSEEIALLSDSLDEEDQVSVKDAW